MNNTEPIMFTLIGITALLLSHPKNIKKWKADPPKKPSHWTIRIVLSMLLLLALSFAESIVFTHDKKYVWLNTICCFALLVLYQAKFLIDMKKYIKNR